MSKINILSIVVFFIFILPSYGQQNSHHRSWVYKSSQDSLFFKLIMTIGGTYRPFKPMVGKSTELGDSETAVFLSKGRFNYVDGIEILTDSVTRRFGILTGMSEETLITIFGDPDLKVIESPSMTSLTYILYDEWVIIKFILYFKEGHYFKALWLSGLGYD